MSKHNGEAVENIGKAVGSTILQDMFMSFLKGLLHAIGPVGIALCRIFFGAEEWMPLWLNRILSFNPQGPTDVSIVQSFVWIFVFVILVCIVFEFIAAFIMVRLENSATKYKKCVPFRYGLGILEAALMVIAYLVATSRTFREEVPADVMVINALILLSVFALAWWGIYILRKKRLYNKWKERQEEQTDKVAEEQDLNVRAERDRGKRARKTNETGLHAEGQPFSAISSSVAIREEVTPR